MDRVTVSEANSVKASKACLELVRVGYALSESHFGIAYGEAEYYASTNKLHGVGLLHGPTQKIVLGFIPWPQRRNFVGVFYFSDKKKNANNRNWVFEVFGRENLQVIKEIAEYLAHKFEVNIHVRLETERSKEETYCSDFMP